MGQGAMGREGKACLQRISSLVTDWFLILKDTGLTHPPLSLTTSLAAWVNYVWPAWMRQEKRVEDGRPRVTEGSMTLRAVLQRLRAQSPRQSGEWSEGPLLMTKSLEVVC